MISLGTRRRSLSSLFYFVCVLNVPFFFKQVLVNVNFIYFKYVLYIRVSVAYEDETELKLRLSAAMCVCVCTRECCMCAFIVKHGR